MKYAKGIAAIIFLFSNTVFAENVRFRTSRVDGQIATQDVEITDCQAVLSCHFDGHGVRKQVLRYPATVLKKQTEGLYTLNVREGSLTEFLKSDYKLLTCAYKLLLIGNHVTEGRVVYGDVVLMGQETGAMSKQDLLNIQNKKYVEQYLGRRVQNILISSNEMGRIIEVEQDQVY